MNISSILAGQRTNRILILLNLIIGAAIFYLFRNQTGGDTWTYLGLADGILEGRYSYWYFTDVYYPDTFRNPGYPLFLSLFRIFTDSIFVIQLFQLLIYYASIFLALKILDHLFGSMEIKNLFLLFLIPSIHVATYTAAIFPEIIVTFMVLLLFWIDMKAPTGKWSRYLILGVLFGILFQIRPVILFIPFLYVVYQWLFRRSEFQLLKNVVMLGIFVGSLLPYALWNQKHHGVFKITSLEGGGGVFHLGYWAMKMPDHYESRYWNNYCAREMISFIDESDREQNIADYNKEWDQIDALVQPLLTARDSTMIELQKGYPKLFPTYTAAFTLKREEVLKDFALMNIMNDLPWYVKVKVYSAIRLWVTGIPMRDWETAGFAKKIYLAYPFVLTLITFISALILIPYLFVKFPKARSGMLLMLLVALYFGFMHTPFTIQSRYTIPVRFEVLMMIATAVYFIFLKPKSESSNGDQPKLK